MSILRIFKSAFRSNSVRGYDEEFARFLELRRERKSLPATQEGIK